MISTVFPAISDQRSILIKQNTGAVIASIATTNPFSLSQTLTRSQCSQAKPPIIVNENDQHISKRESHVADGVRMVAALKFLD